MGKQGLTRLSLLDRTGFNKVPVSLEIGGKPIEDCLEDAKKGCGPYQEPLVSGENIKTINGQSVLGSGDLNVDRHFRGWFDSASDLPADGRYGDYANVYDSVSEKTFIYKWDASLSTPAWVNSEVEVDTSGVSSFETGESLNEVPIDDTHLANPADGALPKAEDVMQLKAKLEMVTASETKVTSIEDYKVNSDSGYYKISGSSIAWQTNSNFKSTKISVTGYKRVRFLGYSKAQSESYTIHPVFVFLDTNSEIMPNIWHEYYDSSLSDGKCEYLIYVPENAAYLICLYVAYGGTSAYQLFTESEFYCYLESGDTVGEMINKLEDKLMGYYDDSIVSENYASTISSGDIRVGIYNTEGVYYVNRGADYYRCGYLTNISTEFRKVHVLGHSSKKSYLIFTKKKLQDLESGTYGFDELSEGGYLCAGATQSDFIVGFSSSAGVDSNSIDVDVPKDAMYLYIMKKNRTGSNCAPQQVIFFSKFIKGEVEKIIDEKEVNVVDNLESDSTTFALSANQGRIIGDRLSRLSLLYFEKKTLSFTKQGLWGTSSDYGHSLVPVRIGEKYRIENYNSSSDNIRYAYLTSDTVEPDEAMPLVENTSVVTVTHGNYVDIIIPEGCLYLTFTTDAPSSGANYYKVRLYKHIYFPDKDFFDEDLQFTDGFPIDALSYHTEWNKLVSNGIAVRSTAFYMSWDLNNKYPLYTYRIRVERDWMNGSYYINQNTDYQNPFYYRKKIMITCGIHGNERLTPNSFLKWINTHINDDVFATYDFVIIPLCNPWGYSHTMLDGNGNVAQVGTSNNATQLPSGYSVIENTSEIKSGLRKTRSTNDETIYIDINRDFVDGTKFQTEEAQYIRDVFIEEKPDMVIDFHQDFNDGSSNKKCGFVSNGYSVVYDDEWQEIRRKSSVCIDKANYITDVFINKGFADRKQFSFVWGGKENIITGESTGVWKNYASGGTGNTEHQDCASKFAFTFETDTYCILIDGTNTANNQIAKNYGYLYMTNFLKYIFDVFNMN